MISQLAWFLDDFPPVRLVNLPGRSKFRSLISEIRFMKHAFLVASSSSSSSCSWFSYPPYSNHHHEFIVTILFLIIIMIRLMKHTFPATGRILDFRFSAWRGSLGAQSHRRGRNNIIKSISRNNININININNISTKNNNIRILRINNNKTTTSTSETVRRLKQSGRSFPSASKMCSDDLDF